ncbi:MAG: NAAT family transporter [Elusimicrobia bacterium]|nr:NAAT family transporter [Elusimicrobiota bacterium]MDE2237259.1 NAAT family transporter [Elusimicrobiota bacterium]MDE2424335.1 NAAT family transporter [Elusimicrobiota bacterium]
MKEYALLTFSSLFAIVDPFAAIPTFLAMTARANFETRRHTARTACLVCWLVLSAFAALGPLLFRMMNITLAAFQIAGGLVLLLSALDMLRAQKSPLRETPEETEEGMGKQDIAVTPLAVPMLAGPGAITTAIVLNGHATDWGRTAIFFAIIAIVSALTYFILTAAARGARRFPSTLLNIVTRLMGLLLAAIGVQFILTALKIA